MIALLNASLWALILIAQIKAQRDSRLLLSAGIETFQGTVGGTNVTRLVTLALPGLANNFAAKTVAEPVVVFGLLTDSGKWDYYRTNWRRVAKRKR